MDQPPVSFEDEQKAEEPVRRAERQPRGITGTLISMGIVKTEAAANVLLVLGAFVAIAAAIVVVVAGSPKPHIPSAEELEVLRQMQAAGKN